MDVVLVFARRLEEWRKEQLTRWTPTTVHMQMCLHHVDIVMEESRKITQCPIT